MPKSVGFPIGFVSLQSGLSTHVIRAWERRYNAVSPQRSESRRRLYNQADIDRLVLLKRVIQNGHSISHIAGLETEELVELAGDPVRAHDSTRADPNAPADINPKETIAICTKAVATLDGHTLYRMLQQAALTFSRQALLEKIIMPFMEVVGRRWSDGSFRIVHGHMASAIIHAQLNSMLDHPNGDAAQKPCLLIATPAGQRCYLGALAVAITAQDHGWEPIFLGYNLPAEEIAFAYSILNPQMIALSITCRVKDDFMHDELVRLSNLLKDQCPLFIGGRACHTYHRSIDAVGGEMCSTTAELVNQLA